MLQMGSFFHLGYQCSVAGSWSASPASRSALRLPRFALGPSAINPRFVTINHLLDALKRRSAPPNRPSYSARFRPFSCRKPFLQNALHCPKPLRKLASFRIFSLGRRANSPNGVPSVGARAAPRCAFTVRPLLRASGGQVRVPRFAVRNRVVCDPVDHQSALRLRSGQAIDNGVSLGHALPRSPDSPPDVEPPNINAPAIRLSNKL